jgi:hypothetical protein
MAIQSEKRRYITAEAMDYFGIKRRSFVRHIDPSAPRFQSTRPSFRYQATDRRPLKGMRNDEYSSSIYPVPRRPRLPRDGSQ